MANIVVGEDGQPRCGWSASAPEFDVYHDAEWGYPVGDDIRLFEKICLESFQSGLSWRTILAKRENFAPLSRALIGMSSPHTPMRMWSACCRMPGSSATEARSKP